LYLYIVSNSETEAKEWFLKRLTHTWITIQAITQLERLCGRSGSRERNRHLQRLLDFLHTHQASFSNHLNVPNRVLCDHLAGGNYWPRYIDEKNGVVLKHMPPVQNLCQLRLSRTDWKVRLTVDRRNANLPSRCEAISQTIRDMFIIRNRLPVGDVLMFNDRQIALFFAMLAYYVADAHMPLHCDIRELPEVHQGMEACWEEEIRRHYRLLNEDDPQNASFALDNYQHLQYREGIEVSPTMARIEQLLQEKVWGGLENRTCKWNDLLGNQNRNIWDYINAISRISFFISRKMFPPEIYESKREALDCATGDDFRRIVYDYMPLIMVDAVNSVALVWLSTWERWELRERMIEKAERTQKCP
jgi:hypothetical protein